MDIAYDKELSKNSYSILREAGYIPIYDRRGGKRSYILRLTQNRYPRFHVYVEDERDDFLKLHLHLDQREHGFGERLHDTEYNSDPVRAEASRLQRWLQHFTVARVEKPAESEDPKKGFFSRFFG